jgi:hypothetical protein
LLQSNALEDAFTGPTPNLTWGAGKLRVPGCGAPDLDKDGFDDDVELYLGTDPFDACPDDPADDAWPVDMNKDTYINVLDMFQFVLADVLGTELGDPEFDARFDLNVDESIDVLDLFQYVSLDVLATECTNP